MISFLSPSLRGYSIYENQGQTPFELLALLLFMLPLLLTFQKLVELVALGERNHQLVEITEYNLKIFTDSGQRLETTLI